MIEENEDALIAHGSMWKIEESGTKLYCLKLERSRKIDFVFLINLISVADTGSSRVSLVNSL